MSSFAPKEQFRAKDRCTQRLVEAKARLALLSNLAILFVALETAFESGALASGETCVDALALASWIAVAQRVGS